MKSTKTKWWVAFKKLSSELLRIKQSTKTNVNAGEKLFRLLDKSDFIESNNWILKFKQEFGIHSLDPLHIFACFNGSLLSREERSIRFNKTLSKMDHTHKQVELDFDGCPTPVIQYELSIRNLDRQSEIWDLFDRGINSGLSGFKESDLYYESARNSSDLKTLSVFLFWINSDFFLSLDDYTTSLLHALEIVKKPIRKYSQYIYWVRRIKGFDNVTHHTFGKNGLLREIVFTADQVINLSIKEQENSSNYAQMISSLSGKVLESSFGYRILALETIKGRRRHLANLKDGVLFKFENSFEINEDESIYVDTENLINIYDRHQGENLIKINISSILGQNGSGKSTITELLYKIINNLSYCQTYINNGEIEVLPDLYVKLYYFAFHKFQCLIFNGSKVETQDYTFANKVFRKYQAPRSLRKNDLENFFYTIAINHSLYGLNSQEPDAWIDKLFHKNDAYQIPLVINPLRKQGVININTENKLANSRLLALLFSDGEVGTDGFKKITDSLIVDKVTFEFDDSKIDYLYRWKNEKGQEFTIGWDKFPNDTTRIFQELVKSFDILDLQQKSGQKVKRILNNLFFQIALVFYTPGMCVFFFDCTISR